MSLQHLGKYLRYDWPCHFVLLLTNWLPDNVIFLKIRGWLVRPFLGKCGIDLEVGRNVTFYNSKNIQIGNHVYLAYGCHLMAIDTISINDDVLFGPYCVISSGNHRYQNGSFRFTEPESRPICIDSGCWIGAQAVITAGCSLGKGCLIGAGAVVTGDLPEGVLAGGIPARVIRNLDHHE